MASKSNYNFPIKTNWSLIKHSFKINQTISIDNLTRLHLVINLTIHHQATHQFDQNILLPTEKWYSYNYQIMGSNKYFCSCLVWYQTFSDNVFETKKTKFKGLDQIFFPLSLVIFTFWWYLTTQNTKPKKKKKS